MTTETDANRGTVTSVTDPRAQKVSYQYDDLNRVKLIYAASDGKTYLNQYVYENDQLKEVRHNTTGAAPADSDAVEAAPRADDVVYTFEYDSKNRRTGVKVGNQYLSKNEYDDTAGPRYGVLARSIYCNAETNPQVVHYTYDDFKRITGIRYGSESENKRYTFEYGANGQVARVTNHELGRVVLSEYDSCSRPMRITHVAGDNHVYTGEVTYDAHSNLARFEETVGTDRTAYSTAFSYDAENKPTLLKYNDSDANKVAYAYDGLGRIATRTVTVGGTARSTSYAYVAGAHGAGNTTGLVASITQTGGNFTYTYDDNGNITKVVQSGVSTAYTYDKLGQLIRVDDGQENATWVYTYDQGGNIRSKKKYALGTTTGTALESKTFSYENANWKDQLTAVNDAEITYDNIGNPLNDGTWTYTWEKGRQLTRMQSVDTDASFVYNENGLRVQKTVNGVVTKYTLHGKNVVHMTSGGNDLHFFYDAANKPAVVVFNGTAYAYVKNLQGDIVGILDNAGNWVVEYTYDAWGVPTSRTGSMADTLGVVNPFRYRGYVYDQETGLYYLRSRYYNPVSCRFLNADIVYGGNMYAYCNNCPLCRVDADGMTSVEVVGEDNPFYIPDYIEINVSEAIEAESLGGIGIARQTILDHSQKTKSLQSPPPYVAVSTLFNRFDQFIDKKINFRSNTDSGCGSFIRGGILNKYGPHGSHVYKAGASSMFNNDMIVTGNIDDVGGFDMLIPGMILGTSMEGTFTDNKYHVEHVGVYAGIRDLGQGPVHAVYSFNTDTNRGNLLPYDKNNWEYYGWHKGIVMD